VEKERYNFRKPAKKQWQEQTKGNYMKCPLCKIEMGKKTGGGVEVDACNKCKGIWFEKDELRKAKDSADKDINWMDFEIWKHKDKFKADPRKLACPKCNLTLVAINYGHTNIEIDYCPTCAGIWLDRGEFEKIIESLTEELITKSFSDYIKDSLVEAKEIVTGPESFLSEWKDFTTILHMMELRMFVEHPKLLEMVNTVQRIPIK
jgi:Zn-finger nucleic acid-binding protein